MVLLAVTGEAFSYLGVFTTNCFFEVLEASCWMILMSIGAVCGFHLWLRLRRRPGCKAAKRFTGIMAFVGITYSPYMVLLNIPMYYQRWKGDQAHHKQYVPIMEGIRDAAMHRFPTSEWSAWENDWCWMLFYFSFAVWSSIFLIYAPRVETPHAVESRELVAGIVGLGP
jgi:hypothetical protein